MTGCILKQCAHHGYGRCEALRRCGAQHVLNRAQGKNGYRVFVNDNPTVKALLKAGLVKLADVTGPMATVIASAETKEQVPRSAAVHAL